MTEQLISLDTARLAKEKGFKWGVYANYYLSEDTEPFLTKYGDYDWPQRFSELDTDFNSLDSQFGEYLSVPTQSLLQKWLRDEHKVHVEIHYEIGFWMYLLHELPSDEDVKFAESGECQDGDLWLDSNLINEDWYRQEFKSYEEALEAGLKEALNLLTSQE